MTRRTRVALAFVTLLGMNGAPQGLSADTSESSDHAIQTARLLAVLSSRRLTQPVRS